MQANNFKKRPSDHASSSSASTSKPAKQLKSDHHQQQTSLSHQKHPKKLNPAQRLQNSKGRTGPSEQHQPSHQLTSQPKSYHTQFNLVPTPETSKPRPYTLSVAISATMLSHLEKPELKTFVAGQIGRTLALFEVDEVIVYNDTPTNAQSAARTTDGTYEASSKKNLDPKLFLARLLQYLEAPPYIRKSLFPVHRDLQYVGLLHPLEAPHHMKFEDLSLYRGEF
jgi:hypothetical protein